MKTIKVIILKGGVMAREVNPFGDKAPTGDVTYTKGNTVIYGKEKEDIYKAQLMNWEIAEAKLRVFDIDSLEICEPKTTQDKHHLAVILPSGKIKIIPDKDSFYETFAKKIDGTLVTDTFQFRYTNLGEPNFIKNGANFADKSHSISLRDWTPEDLEAMAYFMRENPLCKLMKDGSGLNEL